MTPEKVTNLRKRQLEIFENFLRNYISFSLVKFNDGEWHAMRGKNGANCDNHPYSEKLQQEMISAYKFLNNRADVLISDYITNFNVHPEFEPIADKLGYPRNPFLHFALLHDLPYKGQSESLTPQIKAFYQTLRDIDPARKMLVAPGRVIHRGQLFVGAKHTTRVPLINAYDSYGEWTQPIHKFLTSTPDPVLLLSCGFNSCLVAKNALMVNPKTTIIDLGSAIDPIVFGKTRKSQMGTAELREFYKDFNITWGPMPHYFEEIPGWFNFPDLYSQMVARFPSGSKFVEVGAWMGKSASYMGVEIMNSGKKISFDVVDSFKGSKEEQNGAHAIAKSVNVKGMCANNLRPLWSTNENNDPYDRKDNILRIRPLKSSDAAPKYQDRSIDFVFIDAGHTYEEVKEDIELWLPKVKKGGVIAGHDYGSKSFPGVERAVTEKFGARAKKVSKNCWMVEV